jgi:hypothetical protein
MKTQISIWPLLTAVALAASALHSLTFAQPTNRPGRGFGPMGPQVVSPEVTSDRKITFRILAPSSLSDLAKPERGTSIRSSQGSCYRHTQNGPVGYEF